MAVRENSPFFGIQKGDIIQVIYDGAQVSLMQVTKIRNYSIQGKDGDCDCKVTWVSDSELRFYAPITPVRTSVLRCVKIKKVSQ